MEMMILGLILFAVIVILAAVVGGLLLMRKSGSASISSARGCAAKQGKRPFARRG
jgi:hypothetical protein